MGHIDVHGKQSVDKLTSPRKQDSNDDDEPFGGITSSHRTLVRDLNWHDKPAKAVEDRIFDSFWIRMPVSRKRSLSIAKQYSRNIEPIIEKALKEYHPVVHAGSYPFSKTLYYATSSVEDLIEKGKLTIDFPMIGGYVGYDPSLSESEVENQYQSVRSIVTKAFQKYDSRSSALEGNFGNDWDIHWGSVENAMQHPNMVYFEETNRFLYLSDEFPGQVSPHSIFFEYRDVLEVENQSRTETIEFKGITGSEYEDNIVSTSVSDISIVVHETTADQFGPVIDTEQVSEHSLSDMEVTMRDPYQIKLTREVRD